MEKSLQQSGNRPTGKATYCSPFRVVPQLNKLILRLELLLEFDQTREIHATEIYLCFTLPAPNRKLSMLLLDLVILDTILNCREYLHKTNISILNDK